MMITASGGTDGANVVLFWPDNLPDDADALMESDPVTLLEGQRDEGKLVWFPCGGDGAYTLAVYVRSAVPAGLLACCRHAARVPALVVRGVGYFGGAEYVFKHAPCLRERHPGMCQPVDIPTGTYAARVYRTEVPDELRDAWLASRVGRGSVRLWHAHGAAVGCALAGLTGAVVAALALPGLAWVWGLALAAGAGAVAVRVARTDGYARVARARELFDNAYPSYVVHLE